MREEKKLSNHFAMNPTAGDLSTHIQVLLLLLLAGPKTKREKREDKKEEETMAMATTTTLVEFIISERYTAGRARESFVFFFSFLVRDFRLKESLRQSVGG